MIFKYCPDCGQNLEATFKFCPSCGFKIPKGENEEEVQPVTFHSTSSSAQTEPSPKAPNLKCSPVKLISPKKEIASPKRKRESDLSTQKSPVKSPLAAKSPKGKRQKNNPLELNIENEILTDQNNKKWKLIRLLSQHETESGLFYTAQQVTGSTQCNYMVKVDAKDGRIFNEQIFLQRAAKPVKVDKWVKSHVMTFLGIPTCISFGFHENAYRKTLKCSEREPCRRENKILVMYGVLKQKFLVFPDMGYSLQSIVEKNKKPLSEKAVFQLAYKIIDVLEYIHANEYVHADIKAENIYVNPNDLEQVYLAGYSFAFRYCPDGKHVEYKEGSRTPHEGTVELISVDAHKGAGPSRRSDLENLGYCILKALCGSLPWSDDVDSPYSVMETKLKYKDDLPGFLKSCFKKRKIPNELKKYLQHVVSLKYEEKPDYEEIRKQLKDGLRRLKASPDDPLDLTITTRPPTLLRLPVLHLRREEIQLESEASPRRCTAANGIFTIDERQLPRDGKWFTLSRVSVCSFTVGGKCCSEDL
ncbi:inactive serine/threonine-protein kinase VRK3-like isoform X2 [Hypanus sabinus]|uniref:inactive serine/threonine-protein kinase VRK3-like isoform X2 n=1 Tax=Hypanus sabinus TaxID=79690 RepID=UPI0028C508C0|nr:inactive serine/threonine-protein kinase VRK3-like isoform X2 [Hypanus sabinus]